MVDTGQCLSPLDREILAQRRARRDADPIVQELRREVRNLRCQMAGVENDEEEKPIREKLIATHNRLLRRISLVC